MQLIDRSPTGAAFLGEVTRLLQDSRLADSTGGLWEAADLQWWWRLDQRADPTRQRFWYRGEIPVVAAVLTTWRQGLAVDLLGTEADVDEHAELLWDFVDTQLGDRGADMLIRVGDDERIAVAQQHGFAATDEADRTGWLDAGMRPRIPALPAGYEIASYAGGSHPMAARNGAQVAERLAECSLYDPDLDLAIRSPDGSVAGYALFWADPVTGVGLVEPMRVEDAHQGRGLSRVLIASGLDRLAAQGCSRLKVSFDPSNAAAVALYTGAGFQVRSESRTFRRAGVPA